MKKIFCLFLMLALAAGAHARVINIKSPDRNVVLSLDTDANGKLKYCLYMGGLLTVDWSEIGYSAGIISAPKVTGVSAKGGQKSVRKEWKPLWGKRSVVPDRYNQREFTVVFNGLGSCTLQVRVYDDGAAFRFTDLPAVKMMEKTEFNFAGNYTAWFYNGERHNIGPERLTESDGEYLPVMTVKASQNRYLALHEACLGADGWPMRLRSRSGSASFEVIPEQIDASSPFTSAWRVIMCADAPGGLVDSHLLELLNPDPEGDFSWVRPGVALWDWRIDGAVWEGYRYGMNYDSWTRMIDFAAEQGFSHLVLDANWYGPEFSASSNPVNGDKAQDVQRIIKYGIERGVGVWLYLNDVAGTRYPIEETLAQYEQWGAAGVKYGFMNGTPLEKNRKTQEITRLCAEHHLMVDYHDYPVHPYGQMRTWPNAVTREYCKAQLDGKQIFQPKTFVTSVFVNMLAGPLDMNNGFMELHQGRTTRKDNSQEVPSTATGEIARTMITWSGATVIPDIPEYYHKYPQLLEFLAAEKQPWKESRTLAGEIGESIVMMRQNADGDFLVAAATDESARKVSIPLSFLPKGSWTATLNMDTPDANYRTNREHTYSQTMMVDADTTLEIQMAPGGGACVLIKRD